jgi:hypothetical protein
MLIVVLLSSCGKEQHAGGVTDIGNSVSVLVLGSKGESVEGARVALVRYKIEATGTLALDSLHGISDVAGQVSFENLPTGEWTILGESKVTGKGIGMISITDKTIDSVQVFLGEATLLRGRIVQIPLGGRSFIPGVGATALSEKISGQYLFSQVPQGKFQICYTDAIRAYCRAVQTLDQRDTLDLIDMRPTPDLSLNTVTYTTTNLPAYYLGKDFTGASLLPTLRIDWTQATPQQGLGQFPLMVRLQKSDINYSEFERNGSNLRITDGRNQDLAFEIEEWDSANGSALLWVSLDTILAGQSGVDLRFQSLPMSTEHRASTVFSPSEGFASVLHFSEDTLAELDTIHDASGSGHDGIIAQAALGRTGMFGKGLDFDGDNDRVELGSWDPCAADFTASLWVRWNGFNGHHQVLFAKRNAWLPDSTRWQWHYDLFSGAFGSYQIDSLSRAQFSSTKVPEAKWSLLTLVYRASQDSVSMWVDGIALDGPKFFAPGNAVGALLRLGGSDAGESWNGAMDEVRLEQVARSEDYIRLAWYTQK